MEHHGRSKSCMEDSGSTPSPDFQVCVVTSHRSGMNELCVCRRPKVIRSVYSGSQRVGKHVSLHLMLVTTVYTAFCQF